MENTHRNKLCIALWIWLIESTNREKIRRVFTLGHALQNGDSHHRLEPSTSFGENLHGIKWIRECDRFGTAPRDGQCLLKERDVDDELEESYSGGQFENRCCGYLDNKKSAGQT